MPNTWPSTSERPHTKTSSDWRTYELVLAAVVREGTEQHLMDSPAFDSCWFPFQVPRDAQAHEQVRGSILAKKNRTATGCDECLFCPGDLVGGGAAKLAHALDDVVDPMYVTFTEQATVGVYR